MTNGFLEHHDSWKAKHSESSSYGFPMLKTLVGTLQFRILDEIPTSRILHFNSVGKRPVICPEEGCIFCARGDESTTQHYINVVDRSDDKVKVLVYTKAAADAISDMIRDVAKTSAAAQFNHPKKYDTQLTRVGTGKKDTRYTAKAIKKDFSPDAYTPFDISSKLVPMPVEEQLKTQGKQDAPSADISGRGLQRWVGTPPSQAVKTPPVETVINDDDKEL